MAERDIEELRRLREETARTLRSLSDSLTSSARAAGSQASGLIARASGEGIGGARRFLPEAAPPASQRAVAEGGFAAVEPAARENTRALREVASGLAGNTGALSENTSAYTQGVRALVDGLGGFLRQRLGGGVLRSGFGVSPLGFGLLRLFRGGGEREGREFHEVRLPAALSLEAANARGRASEARRVVRGAGGDVRVTEERPLAAGSPQVVVNVNAMDARSFQDRAGDIANAVRDAMLHMHPVNDVIGEL